MMPRPDPELVEQWAVDKLKLPPRGSGQPLRSRDDRTAVRFWLRSLGASPEKVSAMTMQQLSDAWHNA
jgi:hypothetical protein